MRRFTHAVLMPLLLTAALTLAPPSFAAAAPPPATTGINSGAVDDPLAPDSAWGVVAAAGCGLFTRWTIMTGGTQVGTIVGAVACCLYVLVDGLVSDSGSPK
jgi:hypothetical protein